ncbi:hypothetical protein SNK04_014010 [Fusarium graminearum]
MSHPLLRTVRKNWRHHSMLCREGSDFHRAASLFRRVPSQVLTSGSSGRTSWNRSNDFPDRDPYNARFEIGFDHALRVGFAKGFIKAFHAPAKLLRQAGARRGRGREWGRVVQ